MSTRDVKAEIQKVLETIPENVLEDVMAYLKQVQGQTKENLELSKYLKQILQEDKDLIQKLAK
ncbi:MAG TPA: hypothetical protein VK927_04060 [Adhaeribacter sp.]|nr:hypothetical protein [Adhaeribacter sp.]